MVIQNERNKDRCIPARIKYSELIFLAHKLGEIQNQDLIYKNMPKNTVLLKPSKSTLSLI
jgi:hypothetical protein